MKKIKINIEEIIRNVKGIKILKTQNIEDLDKRIHAIYGANGSGKSSFKDAIIRHKNKSNWNITKQENWVHEKIKSKDDDLAVFDERIVNLIRYGKKADVKLFGDKIDSLYDLLIDRTNELSKKDKKEIIEEYLLKIDTKKFQQKIDTINEIIKIINKMKFNDDIDFEINHEIINLLIKKINSVFYLDFWSENIRYTNDYKNFYYFNGLENVKELMTYIIRNKFDKENKSFIKNLITYAKNELKTLITFFKNLHFIIENFGYIKLENQFKNFLENSKIFKINSIEKNANNIQKIIETFQDKTGEIMDLKEIWDKIYERICKVKKIANNLLNIYNLDYCVELSPTDITRYRKGNFSLSYMRGKKKLTETEIAESVSYGELNVISLCIFLSSCLVRGIPNNSHFIFDDPISSYDLNKVQITINIINELILNNKKVKKIHFMSHEKHFIKSLQYPIKKEDKKDLVFWNLIKNNEYSELKQVTKMESDFDFYKKMLDSKNIITKLISQRFFLELEKEISNEELIKNKNKKKINEINKKIHGEIKITEDIKDILEKEEIMEEDVLSIRNYIEIKHDGFLKKWVPEKLKKIIKRINDGKEINNNDMIIFRISMYRVILNFLSHSNDGGDVNMDISRTSEIIDIILSNSKKIIKDFNDGIKMWKSKDKNN